MTWLPGPHGRLVGPALLGCLLLVALLLPGCGSDRSASSHASSSGPSPSSSAATAAAGVPLDPHLCARPTPEQRARLPHDHHYTGVSWCSAAARGTGKSAPPPRVVHGDVSALLDALNAPATSASRSTPTPCAHTLVASPTLWLLDDHGRAFLAPVPTDSCHQPSEAVTTALTGLFE